MSQFSGARCAGVLNSTKCRFCALSEVHIEHTVSLRATLCSYHRQLMRRKARKHRWIFSARRLDGAPRGNPLFPFNDPQEQAREASA